MLGLKKIIANRFVINNLQRDLVGQGGMSDVYRGVDTQTGEPVAIKALKSHLISHNPNTLARFRREADALRRLNHPNIVKMIAAIEEAGQHYLIMEYVGGGSLREQLDQGEKLPLSRVLEIAIELADALSRTHHLQIVHRDLKPANVLLAEDGTPRLTDFGVASIADGVRLTQTGMWVGTPHYLSPEACNGEQLDARADVWSFGIMLYEMITGEVPFAGETLVATMTAIFRSPVPNPSQLRPDAPYPLVNLIDHMLAKERHERISSMRLVAAELETIARGETGQLPPRRRTDPVEVAKLSTADFEGMVTDALKLYREGDWLELGYSPLARTPLVFAYFLPGEPVTPDAQGQALSFMLQWGIEKMKPGGDRDWLDSAWRHYNILHGFYVTGERVSDLTQKLAIAPQTFYGRWRPQAITALAKIIRREIETEHHLAERKRFAALSRYHNLNPPAQTILRALAVFDTETFVPAAWLQQMTAVSPIADVVQTLVEANLAQWNTPLTAVGMQPSIRPHIYTQLSLSERKSWHRAAAQHHLADQSYLKAAKHQRQAGDVSAAASILVEHQQAIFDQFQVEALGQFLNQFRAADLADESNLWAELKLVSGKVAEYLENVKAAVAEYGEALAAPDLYTKARAYYLRAKAFERLNLDESLAHYDFILTSINIRAYLENGQENPDLVKLIVQMRIHRAWIFIQERPDQDRAEMDLAQAETLMTTIMADDPALWSDLYNARAGLAQQRGDAEEALSYRMQAWVTANEAHDAELMMKTAYNLGQDYVWEKQYQQGLHYLERSNALARESGNLQIQGMTHKGMGSCYFFQGAYKKAIDHYLAAYQILLGSENANWRTALCQDLTEAYAEIGDWPTARRYYEEARTFARQLGHERYVRINESLAKRYPALVLDLNARQEEALAFVQEKGRIAMRQYLDLSEVSRSQAHRDLKALCEQGVLRQVGEGRAAHYILPEAN